MKKSEKIHAAMLAVVNAWGMDGEVKLEVLEMLMNEKSLAEYVERTEVGE